MPKDVLAYDLECEYRFSVYVRVITIHYKECRLSVLNNPSPPQITMLYLKIASESPYHLTRATHWLEWMPTVHYTQYSPDLSIANHLLEYGMEFLLEMDELCSQDPAILGPLSRIIHDWILTRSNHLEIIRRAEKLLIYHPLLMKHFIAFLQDCSSIRRISVEGDMIFALVTTRFGGDEVCAISRADFDAGTTRSLRSLVYDTRQLRALVMSEVLDPWKWLWELGSGWATYIMELLQGELDESRQIHLLSTTHEIIDYRREENFTSQYRQRCLKALRSLAKTFGGLPNSFYVENVVRVGRTAVSGGGFADIWRGRLDEAEVCLKVLRTFTSDTDATERVLKEFCEEVLIWKQFDHPNLLPFIGVNKTIFFPNFCFVSPWMRNGNIMAYLKEHPEQDRLPWISQVANGLQYLHGLDPPIIHGDIRGANILVTDDLRCCLADFGLALVTESPSVYDTLSTPPRGSVRWMAPEILHPDLFHLIEPKGRDIYALGCTVVEILSGQVPFPNIKHEIAVAAQVLLGQRPKIPSALTEISIDLAELVHSCWNSLPSQRPSAEEISCFLSFYVSDSCS